MSRSRENSYIHYSRRVKASREDGAVSKKNSKLDRRKKPEQPEDGLVKNRDSRTGEAVDRAKVGV